MRNTTRSCFRTSPSCHSCPTERLQLNQSVRTIIRWIVFEFVEKGDHLASIEAELEFVLGVPGRDCSDLFPCIRFIRLHQGTIKSDSHVKGEVGWRTMGGGGLQKAWDRVRRNERNDRWTNS